MNLTQVFIFILNQTTAFFGGNLGLSIIFVTLVIRSALLPLVLPSLKSQKKLQSLKPQIDELKRKYGKDKEVFAKKQMELYKEHGVNPLGGCLPQLVQLGLFIVFYRVLITSLDGNGTLIGSVEFFWLNLTQPDKTYLLPVLAGATQFLLGLMLLPATDTSAEKTLASQTESAKDDQGAMDMDAMAKTMQSQMIFVMPLVTAFIALNFPSGLALYWVVSTVYSMVQQYYISGLGGINTYLHKLRIIK